MDKVMQEITPLGSISYTYDELGRRTSMTVAGQEAVNYSYDADSRLTGINTTINGVAQGFSLAYDALGRRTSLSLPNGITTNYSYDNASRLLNLEHLNPVNQILEKISYGYDANGNRTSMNRLNLTPILPDPVANTAYNAANQMLTFNTKNIAYDENGNMTTITNFCGTTTYSWDARNRLVAISGYKPDCSALTASFKYDALGRRIEKTINGKTIQYLYDGADIVQEIENGTVSVNYIRTLNIDEPLARVKSDGTVRYYQTDALGSVIALTDESGVVKTQYVYDPFGNTTMSGEVSDNPFQFAGRENDGTGLLFERNRYYSFELQRYISEDPIRLAGGDVNLYVRVGNSPVNLTDPLGLQAIALPAPIPIPLPLPPVFIPGTPENKAFGDSVRRIIDAIGERISRVTPKPAEQCEEKGKWTCQATCHETPYGGVSKNQRIISAMGGGPTQSTACQNAIKNCQASSAPGTYTRHCQCPKCWRR